MSLNKTSIEWVKNPDGTQGYTWNPITGCLNHIDGMCKGGGFPCYAYKLANGRLRGRYLSANTATAGPKAYLASRGDPFYPRFWEDRLEEPMIKAVTRGRTTVINVGKQKGIFVCDMSDLFGIGIPEEWTRKVMQTIEDSPHRFYLLTKQPQNLINFSPFPPHCYVGVTVTKPEFLIPALDAFDSIQCAVRYLSIEPMLAGFDVPDLSLLLAGSVNQVIIGACTSKRHSDLVPLHTSLGLDIEKYGNIWTLQPTIEWVEEIVEACDKAGVAVFLKDNLTKKYTRSNIGLPVEEPFYKLGEDGIWKLRQELPKCNK